MKQRIIKVADVSGIDNQKFVLLNRVPTAPRNSSNLFDFYVPPRISSNLVGKLANK